MHSEIDALIDAASRPYLAAGRYAYYFTRVKLRHDPVFFSLLREGRIPDRARGGWTSVAVTPSLPR